MFCNYHNHQPGRFYCRFSNLPQYQLTPWWRHDLDTCSAIMAFREGTTHEINNAQWISNTDLWWLFVVRQNKLLNKQPSCLWFETQCHWLIVRVMTVAWHSCGYTKFWRLGMRRFRLRVRDIQTKWIIFHFITNPTFHFTLVHTGLFIICLERVYQLALRTVKYERYSQYHYSGTRWASWRLKSTAIQLFTQQLIQVNDKEISRFALLFMYGEQNNTRLHRVDMVAIFDTVLCGANISILTAMAQDSSNRKKITTCVMRNTWFLHPLMASWNRNAFIITDPLYE